MKCASLPLLLAIGLMLWLSTYNPVLAQTLPQSSTALCGIVDLTPDQAQSLVKEANQALQRKRATNPSAFTSIMYVPIRPHIIRRSNGTGPSLTMTGLNQQMAYTNSHYLLNGFGIQFYFAGSTPDYIDNDQLYESFPYGEGSVVDGRDAYNAMNQYYVYQFSAFISGYARYPTNDIISTRSFIATGDGSRSQFLGNQTIPHELGHSFNLYHTFGNNNGTEFTDELVTRGAGANCSTAGDLICDTPADPYTLNDNPSILINGCIVYNQDRPYRDANGDPYSPSVTNIMSYYFSNCGTDFTPGQYDRVQAGLALRQTHTAYTLDAPPTPVTAPSNLTGTFSNNAIILTWQDNANNEMGYFIERSTSPTSGFLPIDGVAPDVTTFTDAQIVPNLVYYYRIRPSNTTTGSLSPTATVTAAPPPLTGLTTTNISIYSAQLNWTSAGAGVTYDVQWRVVGSNTWNTINSVQTNNYILYSLTLNTNYEWQVKTTSGTVYSAPASFTTPCPTPNPYNSSITRTSADLSLGGIYPQTYTLQWRPQGNPNWTTINTGISSFYSLTGLTSSTVYEYEVQATCPGTTPVTTAYSSPLSFTTLSCQTPTAPGAAYVYSTAARLGWNVPNFEPTATYSFRYRPVGQPTWTTIDGLTSTSYSLTGLSTNTAYEWQVQRVCTPTESSTFTAPVSFTTGCRIPTNLSSSPTASAATLSWSISNSLEPGASFEIQYRVIGSSTWATVVSTYYGVSTIWGGGVSGLTVGTTYEWRVRTVCNATSQSDYSATATFTTVCNAPLAYNLSVDQLTSTSARLYLSTTSDPDTRFDIRFRPVGSTNWATLSIPASTATSKSYSLTGLTNNTQYEWEARSVCSETQSSSFTPGPAFTTQCRIPSGLNTTIRATSALVSWASVGIDVSYEVRYRTTGSPNWITISNLTTSFVDLTSLPTNTAYEWQVKTHCSDGASSDFSEISTFTTYSCEYPTNLFAFGLTPTSVQLNWAYLQADTQSRYEARYRPVGTSDWITISNLTSIDLHGTYVLTGLTTGLQYEWQIKTLCSPTESSAFSYSLFFSPCAGMYTVKAGSWDDNTVWSCNRVPMNTDVVQIKHIVTIPAYYVANAQQVNVDAGQKLTYSTNSQLKLGL
ncbi:hypothetical protein GO755_07220 [Spirosoma sp. HMF4905]|uniref:Fibronectin type-III domain-containing protein n=1 Tax=Spirosoma arboris TaxID=2682092 RepID=A0A7K1S892_9BACT|nr:fibronectin type III domain-containing protein [Spirosoma arboris]MVM29816.1 hypothetical protein [Spirosoma arboris]